MRNLWQPGDPTGGGKREAFTKKGHIPVTPVRVVGKMRYWDEEHNIYERHEVEVIQTEPVRKVMPIGRKKGLSSSAPSRPGSNFWPVGTWAGGKTNKETQ